MSDSQQRPRSGFANQRRRRFQKNRRPERKKEEWIPKTKLGRLVKTQQITSIDEIYKYSIPIKEHQIVDEFFGEKLKDEVLKVLAVQKQTKAGQRTRFKAIVVVGDKERYVGLGIKVAKEVAIAIKGALINAKLSIIPVRLGYWGNRIGEPHTVPCKVTGRCGSVGVRLVPAPRGAGIVAAGVPKKLLSYAGVSDVYTSSEGSTKTLGNFAQATFHAIAKTYHFLTPDFWPQKKIEDVPFKKHSDFLSKKQDAQTEDDFKKFK
ncbi:hypothetical protein M0811_03336 [Anaeramoeba ignava]|uniref:Small ribosomal subunit protein uS5 n=1 Tax=Anaeramoeba ignava TaxID=1746090 RepID=A0A9Q0L615_ANAIG|nr:hypothetical protein M0811_03336 [Anaeramoeba ignava]|eukprot:Anaeramoba_ignava/a98133_524.p1 GENE.a98133_524~~a98133_524.p1  ORF type:complete len:279 (-),score=44.36 a98133_524:25-813(-)